MAITGTSQKVAWGSIILIETVPFLVLCYVVVAWAMPMILKRDTWSSGEMFLFTLALVIRGVIWWAAVKIRWWGYQLIVLDLLFAVFFLMWRLVQDVIPESTFLFIGGTNTIGDLSGQGGLYLLIAAASFKAAVTVLFPLTIHETIIRSDDRVNKMVDHWTNMPQHPNDLTGKQAP